jgi:hypothetical protein
MHTGEVSKTLATLFRELIEGVPKGSAYVLNGGDIGLLRSLDNLSAEGASQSVAGGGTIAAHVDHLRYGISLMNRWSGGEDPWSDADWTQSWKVTGVNEPQWKQLRAQLRNELTRWLQTLGKGREVNEIEMNGMVGTIVHLAYHLGAIRQIDKSTRGPTADD